MKKFFTEFKKFISRGNVIDMAIGVIIGSAFSAIVTALTNKILMPLINALLAQGGNGLESAYTFLVKGYAEDGTLDLAKSIYIDWGAFITAIINFFLIALVLFVIMKAFMNARGYLTKQLKKGLTKEQKRELKARGVKLRDKEAVKAELAKMEQEKEEARKAELAAQPKVETEVDLLKEIRELLKAQAETKKK